MRWWGTLSILIVTVACVPRAGGLTPEGARAPSTVLIDGLTGQALQEHAADEPRPAGSFSQLMLVLLALEDADRGALSLDQSATLTTAPVAATAPGRKAPKRPSAPPVLVPLEKGRPYPLRDVLRAVMLTAADDAVLALSETVAESPVALLDRMNARAQSLGMTATQFAVPLGMAPSNEPGSDVTSARDVARLAQALIGHTPVLEWTSVTGVPFDRGAALLRNTNQLIGKVAGADGLHCSSIRLGPSIESYSIVATAQRGGLRLIAVALDAGDSAARYDTAAEALEWGFAHYERLEVVKEGDPMNFSIGVTAGAVKQVTPIAGATLSLLHGRDEERDLQVRYQVPTEIAAPVRRQQRLGELIVEENGELIAVIPLISPANVASTDLLSALP
jgi:serine-type D-Ala-D-Ala carboxypeptidase (penicillin-binding protein 5/6)